MSGGSWDYMFGWEAEKFIAKAGDLAGMARRLMQLGFPDAAAAMEEFSLLVAHARMQVETRKDVLRDVMHAVEWFDSGDSGKESLAEQIRKWRYRGKVS